MLSSAALKRACLGIVLVAFPAALSLAACTAVENSGNLGEGVGADSIGIDTPDGAGAVETLDTDGAPFGMDAEVDAAEVEPPEVCPGGFRCPCESHDDCNSGWCVEGPEGQECSTYCEDTCDPGYGCRQIVGPGGDISFICVYDHLEYCRPCLVADDCKPALVATSANICLENEDGSGAFCATACADDSECPEGAVCAAVATDEGEGGKFCQPTDGVCACSDRAIDAGATTFCFNENELGACEGQRICTEEGLTECDAPEPAEEICNDLDDNCDGLIDNSGGDLDGDGIDDCEDPDRDGDGSPNALDCMPDEPSVYPGGPEICDGLDNDCDGTADDEDADGCTEWYKDADEDGYGSTISKCLCGPSGVYAAQNSLDCDDSRAEVHPDIFEDCATSYDDNCNGITNEDGAVGCTDYYKDGDSDNYGGAQKLCLCAPKDLYDKPDASDCNDNTADIYPGAPEICNEKDDDCDGEIDETFPKKGTECDGDDADKCKDGTWTCDGQALECAGEEEDFVETCNGIDDDCDGATDEDFEQLGAPCDGDDADTCLDGAYVCNQAGDGVVCDDEEGSAPEICNGVDDDCDGLTDEGFDDKGKPCDGTDADVCADGVWVCSADGSALECGDDEASITEVCNNVDDDCDGQIDEGFDDKGVACDGNDGDLCADGTWVCDGTGLICDDDPASVQEVCNDEDDDCDGQVDEGFANKGKPCDGEDADLCEDGQWACDGVALYCNDDPGSGAELCNGQDDDCDGQIDEDFPDKGKACDGSDADQCSDGTWVCDGTNLICDDDPATKAELCNNQDDDCDGQIDEDFPNKNQPCDGSDADKCADGTWTCQNNELVCTDDPNSRIEVCNNVDDDCDGAVDEDFITKGQPCDGSDTDFCTDGTWVCDGSGVYCNDDGASRTEVCNNMDDDCDGQIDEGFPQKGQSCDGGDTDLCADGTWVCDGTQLYCNDDAASRPELCNNADDDCDGQIDEGFDQKGQTCDGSDSDKCADGIYVCDGTGLVCNDDSTSRPELCNNMDDDCDGQVDESFADKNKACDGGDGDLCAEGTWVCNGTDLVCSDNTGTSTESCNNFDDDCDGQIDENLSRPCSTACGQGTESCVGGHWINCNATQPKTCLDYGTCTNQSMCVSSCPAAPTEVCNLADDDCDGQVDEGVTGDSSYGGTDFNNGWYGPEVADYPTYGSGLIYGKILPQGDEDWFSIYAVENQSDICIPFVTPDSPITASVTIKSPGNGLWYEVCACWTFSGQCDGDENGSMTCATASDGGTATVWVDMITSCGFEDAGYLDMVVRPDTPSLDYSCSVWQVTWAVYE